MGGSLEKKPIRSDLSAFIAGILAGFGAVFQT